MKDEFDDIGGHISKENDNYTVKDNYVGENLLLSSTHLFPGKQTAGHKHLLQDEIFFFTQGSGEIYLRHPDEGQGEQRAGQGLVEFFIGLDRQIDRHQENQLPEDVVIEGAKKLGGDQGEKGLAGDFLPPETIPCGGNSFCLCGEIISLCHDSLMMPELPRCV